jgi:hypothetical protein
MRLGATGRERQFKIWMTDRELEDLRRAAAAHRDDLIIQLGGKVGLRAFEISQVCPQYVKRTGDGDHYRLRVWRGERYQRYRWKAERRLFAGGSRNRSSPVQEL